MNANTSIPPEIADTIIATIIYFAATSAVVPMVYNKFKRKKELKNEQKAGNTGTGILPNDGNNKSSDDTDEIKNKEEK